MCSTVSFALGDDTATPKGAPKEPATRPQATTVVRSSVGNLAALGRPCRRKSEGRGLALMCGRGLRALAAWAHASRERELWAAGFTNEPAATTMPGDVVKRPCAAAAYGRQERD